MTQFLFVFSSLLIGITTDQTLFYLQRKLIELSYDYTNSFQKEPGKISAEVAMNVNRRVFYRLKTETEMERLQHNLCQSNFLVDFFFLS